MEQTADETKVDTSGELLFSLDHHDIPETIIPLDADAAPIYVTRPDLPPLEDLIPALERIWQGRVLTNNGPFHQEFEAALAEHWAVENVSLFANGTLALLTALQAVGARGEVITTPFTFAATAHAITWNRLTPVFADVSPESLNLDPLSVESAITPETSAILPVHCYGRACDVSALGVVAEAHDLSLIYDAAHAFGVEFRGRSLLSFGDMSVVSFHATKVLNTFEGGAIVSGSPEVKRHIDNLKNFGIRDQQTISDAGINGKMSEFNAALGLLQLGRIGAAIEKRKAVSQRYRDILSCVEGISIHQMAREQTNNHAYFPILVGDEYPLTRDELHALLVKNRVMARRYFHPLLTDTDPYLSARVAPGGLPNAKEAANRILCLPIYPDLGRDDQDLIVSIIAEPLDAVVQRASRSESVTTPGCVDLTEKV